MRRVFIFGAGAAGRSALKSLNERYHILGFIDNNPVLSGTYVASHKVFPPKVVRETRFDYVMIASEFSEAITAQLLNQYNLSPDKILVIPAAELKPYKFSDDPAKKDAIREVLNCLVKWCDSFDLGAVVFSGTLLGLYRDNALIPWDNDLDMAMPDWSLPKFMPVKDLLVREISMVTSSPWRIDSYDTERAFGPCPLGAIRNFKLSPDDLVTQYPTIDIFVISFESAQAFYTLASRGVELKKEYFIETKLIDLAGYKIRAPENIEDYLADHYGDDWRVPKRTWDLSMLESATNFIEEV
jgi:lipopolysaccharide cholinephosphotransferase